MKNNDRLFIIRYALITIGIAIFSRWLFRSLHGGQRAPSSTTFIVTEYHFIIGYCLIIIYLANSWVYRTMRKRQDSKNKLSKERLLLALINGLSGGIASCLSPTFPQLSIWNSAGILFGGIIIGTISWITMRFLAI
jgi:low temperature requirement protein LtrA